jgi:ATP-dependent RNA helicase RhlE
MYNRLNLRRHYSPFQNRSGNRFSYQGNRRFNRFNRSKIDVTRYVKKAQGSVEKPPYIPSHQFSDFNLSPDLMKNIMFNKFSILTPIQDQSIVYIQEGKDLIGIANTGTGKTAAFLIPLIDRMYKDKSHKVIVVVPTRELALQINEDFRTLSYFMKIFSAVCIGGVPIGRQIFFLSKNPNVVIATPGRLKDLVNRKLINLSSFKTVVLDEADRMLDMGFIDDIRFILNLLPKEKQMLLFSATIPDKVQDLIRTFAHDPIRISVKTGETAENVDQDVVRITDRNKKVDQLYELLVKEEFEKVLIFVNTKIGTEHLKESLVQRGLSAAAINGDKSQSARQYSLILFRQSKVKVLVATDVAARGLDIKGVTHVINYDEPATFDDYIHRIGRTGRAGEKGYALTFIEQRF